MAATSATSLTTSVAHAIAYITRPLISRYPTATIVKLRLALESNLTAHFAPTWVPTEPLRGSGRRCLTLSPTATPPRPLYASLQAANVQWSEWIAALGGVEFDLFVDPGCVSVRFGQWGSGQVGKLVTVWSYEMAAAQQVKAEAFARESVSQSRPRFQEAARTSTSLRKTLAQQLMQADEVSEEELFAAIADEIRDPTWKTPVRSSFPSVPHGIRPKSFSPLPTMTSHSRSSSWSSNASSDFAFSDTSDSASSVTSASYSSTEKSMISRRERARQTQVFIDTSKTEVMNYDGGKTTVLTGGVMLGARSAPKPTPKMTTPRPSTSSADWRSPSRPV
ncbi:hypothetical protein EWM64_g1937 [Hericium alpestre]|uniref:Anti-proliferative protein domain-containing protein n=1 Tax=Hericium alpestre TaxID=135208 RepID=A0A4Z0A6T9_9AGAM|nr:hypothetical protein EWM64_g1937 [Hericium alpestre]